MTPKQHLDAKLRGLDANPGPETRRRIYDAIRAAVAEERERCCCDVCGLCAEGVPLVRVGDALDMAHQRPGESPRFCRAFDIRERARE